MANQIIKVQRFLQAVRRPRPHDGVRAQPTVITTLPEPFELVAALSAVIRDRPGGFTWCPRSGKLITGNSHDEYCVSRIGYERVLRCVPPDSFELLDWVMQAADRLCCDGEYCGGWLDNGRCVLDVSVLIRGLDSAIQFGLANGQHAICHLLTGRCIDVG